MLKTLFRKTGTQKFIASMVLTVMLVQSMFFLVPVKQAEAQYIDPANLAAWTKDLLSQAFKQFKMHVARTLVNKMNQRITQWIASGFHGNPFYLERPQSFFKDIVKYEVKNMVDTYAYNRDKFPFGRSFALNTISAYQRNLEDNTAYTLSKVINDPVFLENYRNDFNVGGWDGFFINTQYPQNNYIGFQMLATEELARKLDGTAQTAADKVNTALEQSGGFLAPQVCETNTKYNNGKNEFVRPRFDMAKFERDNPNTCDSSDSLSYAACNQQWINRLEQAKAGWAKDNECPGGLTTTTPGGVVANQIKTALESKIRQSELAASMGNAVAVGFGMLVDNLINKGLTKLSSWMQSPAGVSAETAGIDRVNLQPNSVPPGGGGNISTCQSVASSIGGSATGRGYTESGEPFSLDIDFNNTTIDNSGDPCTTINIPGHSGADFSEISRWNTGGTTPPPGGGSCGKGCICKNGDAISDVLAGTSIVSRWRSAVVAARDIVLADVINRARNGLNEQGSALTGPANPEQPGSPGDAYVKAVVCVLRSQGYIADGTNDELAVAHSSVPGVQENFDLYNSGGGLVGVRYMAFCSAEGADVASGGGRGFVCGDQNTSPITTPGTPFVTNTQCIQACAIATNNSIGDKLAQCSSSCVQTGSSTNNKIPVTTCINLCGIFGGNLFNAPSPACTAFCVDAGNQNI